MKLGAHTQETYLLVAYLTRLEKTMPRLIFNWKPVRIRQGAIYERKIGTTCCDKKIKATNMSEFQEPLAITQH